MYNLYKNANFASFDWPKDNLEFFFDLFRAAEDKHKREIGKETLIALFSTSPFEQRQYLSKRFFATLFCYIFDSSCDIRKSSSNIEISKDKSRNLEDIFHGLMRNDLIQEIASTVVYEVSGVRN